MTDTRTNTTGDIIPLFGRARIDNDPEIRNRRARDLGPAGGGWTDPRRR